MTAPSCSVGMDGFGRSYVSGNGVTDPGLSGEQSESEAGLGFGPRSLRVEGRGGAGEAL